MRIADLRRQFGGSQQTPTPDSFDPSRMFQPGVFDQNGRRQRSIYDAPQAGLAFVISQASYIERAVNMIMHPDIQYPQLIPVDVSAPEWAPSITFFSQDMTGQAQWLAGAASDIPNADINREKFQSVVHMAGIGYDYTLEEIGQAQMLGMNLPTDKAASARRAYEEFVDNVALNGDSKVNFLGFLNHSSITPANVALNAGASSRLWINKTADEILTDLNEPLQDIHSVSKQVEMADTVLMSVAKLDYLSTKPRASTADTTILKYFKENNVYTLQTGQPLTIRAVRGLETAGASGTERMIAYRRNPEVLKMHIPMPHRFMSPFQQSPLRVQIPGIFRLGGLDIRRPGAVRYRDGF